MLLPKSTCLDLFDRLEPVDIEVPLFRKLEEDASDADADRLVDSVDMVRDRNRVVGVDGRAVETEELVGDD